MHAGNFTLRWQNESPCAARFLTFWRRFCFPLFRWVIYFVPLQTQSRLWPWLLLTNTLFQNLRWMLLSKRLTERFLRSRFFKANWQYFIYLVTLCRPFIMCINWAKSRVFIQSIVQFLNIFLVLLTKSAPTLCSLRWNV
jgi:hypothetical protein